MNDRLREALEWWEAHPKIDATTAELHWFNSIPIVAAARRFLALTETGPDYEAAAEYTRELTKLLPVEFEGSHDAMLWTTKIVDAALADYLTEDSQ